MSTITSRALTPEQLRRVFNADTLDFETTADIDPSANIIGQPRGVAAIEFGMEMQSPGYNIYVLGESGTGRTTAIENFIHERAHGQPVPSDWIYINNFVSGHAPLAIELPAGRGSVLSEAMDKLIERLKLDLPLAFENQNFRDEALHMRQALQAERDALFSAFQKHAASVGAAMLTTQQGFRLVPAKDGQPMEQEAFAALPDEEKEAWRGVQNELEKGLAGVMYQAREIENSAQDRMNILVQRVGAEVVDVVYSAAKEPLADLEQLASYFADVRADVLKFIDNFRAPVAENGQLKVHPDWFRRYAVNVIINQQDVPHAPVVTEYDPTLSRLLGRVEHEARPGGAVATDFTLLRPGALHAANGGYLVLRASDLFTSPGAYDGLKRALLGNAVRPDDPAIRGGAATRSLDPQAIPLNLKVVLIGPPSLYYQLAQGDEDFSTLFKVMADFDHSIERTDDNELAYATFIAARCKDESLRAFDRGAIGKMIEYGARLAGTQEKLSTRFGLIADLAREANHWASKGDSDVVSAENVLTAITNRNYLRNRIESSMRERVMDSKQLIASRGEKVGQINGLAVSQVGDHAFGHPSRITTRTFVGKSGVVAIDREVNMAGAIHNKGLMTLVGYLGGQYATDHPLSLSAQITFEQNYGGIDGDSASSTELYVLLSSLTGIPINQSIAVTGSVNQHGEVQAIGGATHKIEGWFEVCKRQGLTGEQGAMIPASNVEDLMLRDEVVQAVRDGQFRVWSVETIDQGIEIMMGVPAAEVHAKAAAALRSLAETMARFDHPAV